MKRPPSAAGTREAGPGYDARQSPRPPRRTSRGPAVNGFNRLVSLVIAAWPVIATGATTADAEVVAGASWAQPAVDDVRRRAFEWLAREAPAEAPAAAAAWDTVVADRGGDVLDATIAVVEVGDPRVSDLRRAAETDGDCAAAWLDEPAVAPFARDAVKLWLGRQLVRHERFDEALPLLAAVALPAAIDPAALLFHRAACEHWLLETDAARCSLDTLLERGGAIPERYERLARLLRADLDTLADDSLDHVSRRMRDVTRRLGQGMAGPATRRLQDGVVEALDAMIRRLEDQAADAAGGAATAGNAASGGQAPGGGTGGAPGAVRRRDIGSDGDWGDLPPHAREEALQQIGREFPPHYREAIEQYFKRLAAGDDGPS
jgi:hypothetical protein